MIMTKSNQLTARSSSLQTILLVALVAGLSTLHAFADDPPAAPQPAASAPAVQTPAAPATAPDAQVIEDLKKQVEALDQKMRALDQQRQADQKAAAAKEAEAAKAAKSAPKFSFGASGFNFTSADTNFAIGFHGLLQVDSRSFAGPEPDSVQGLDGFILRRARPILSATLFRDFDFMLVPDFGGSSVQIMDAYMNYRLQPFLQLEAGRFKSPVGLEALQSDPACLFNERSLVTDLVPNRDVGVALHGDIAGGFVSYWAGLFNGAPDYSGTAGNSDYDNDKAFAGRLFFQPFKQTDIGFLKGFGFGCGASYEVDAAWTNTSSTGLTSGYTTDGQQKFFTYTNNVVGNGTHWRVSPQGYYYWGPLGLMGEYAISDQQVVRPLPVRQSADLQHHAWEVSGSVVLTGEAASYAGVTPKHNFDPLKGQWGAVQAVARYAELHIDPDAFPYFSNPGASASQAQSWAVGLNWYLNRDIRVNASFSHTRFDGGSQGVVTRQPEQVFFTRMQLAF
jgi:phosphate-selective porin OprO and OprP